MGGPSLGLFDGTTFDEMKKQTAGRLVCFHKFDHNPVAQAESEAATFTSEAVMYFVVNEMFPAQRADGNEAVRPGLVQGDEQAETGDARDLAGKLGADAVA